MQRIQPQLPAIQKKVPAVMVRVERWRAFPRDTAGGNPCPLVTDAGQLTAGQMQAIAAHYGQESAFVTDATAAGARLRYFVPRHEMRMCVHATIAAATALISTGVLADGQAVIGTASGPHKVTWPAGDPPEVTVEQHPPSYGPPAAIHAELTAALGLTHASIPAEADIRPVSVSRAKLIVPVRDGITRTSVTGQAIRDGHDELDLDALTAGRADLPEPELR